jgi:hypothetical protein
MACIVAVMEDKPEKPKGSRWSDISPKLIRFIKTPFSEPPESDDIPEPEDMRWRREQMGSFRARRANAKQPETRPADQPGPKHRIGPRNPDRPNVNHDQGRRDPT